MGIENVNSLDEKTAGRLHEEFSFKKVKLIERFLLISMFLLIGAILLLAFDQILAAGCFTLVAASLGLIVFKNISLLNRKYIMSINSFLKTDGRKDKIITDFSHKIREPLNNLVLTGEMLMESELNSKQKELLDTFNASTKIMVSTVNELTMESAENMSYESRKQIRFNILSTIEHVIELFKLKDSVKIIFTLNSEEIGRAHV